MPEITSKSRKHERRSHGWSLGRDSVLEAVGFAAEQLLSSGDWEEAVTSVLQRLGQATGMSRVYIYKNRRDEDGILVMDQQFEWCAKGIEPTLGHASTKDFPYEPNFVNFKEILASGRAVYGLLADYPASERADMAREGIQSSASVPVNVGGEWWGFIGFDDCESPHEWTNPEMQALTAVGGTLGATIHQRMIERQLFEVEAQFKTLVEQLPAIVYLDPPGVNEETIYISPQIKDILGIDAAEYLHNPGLWLQVLHPDDRERAADDYDSFLATGQPDTSDYRMIRPDGRVVWIHDRARMITDAEGKQVLCQGVMFDVTEQKEAEEQVKFMAYHDRLTGLPNRAMFEEHLELALARAARGRFAVAVLFMDLDNFKLLNDSLGHAAGDDLLQQMSVRLRDATRDTDLIARQGGDEFLVLLGDIEREGDETDPDAAASPYVVAESVATRVGQSLKPPFLVAGQEWSSSASIGISVYPVDAADGIALMKNADAAMYRSKGAGPGNYAIHSRSGPESEVTRQTFTNRLRDAVEHDNWELRYQPIVNLETGALRAVEALVRWKDPTGGIIRPGEFIPLAEEIGLIDAIGDWVLEELCRQSADWRAAGLDLDISYNLSPRQLRHPDLAEHLMPFLEQHDVDPVTLIMEVTESSAMTDPERTQKVLMTLREKGLRLAIDNFGTSTSSFARLKNLPANILKIDRSFVRDVPDDDHAASMVNAIIDLTDSLGMTSIGEGIETEDQRKFLISAGCPEGQGYHFSRPIPASEIIARYHPAPVQEGGG